MEKKSVFTPLGEEKKEDKIVFTPTIKKSCSTKGANMPPYWNDVYKDNYSYICGVKK